MSISHTIATKLLAIFSAALFLVIANAHGNPYLAKPGEQPIRLRIATCAVSGGFVHLYTAIENGLFS